MNELARAMHVLLLTPSVRIHLKKNDPMAFRQAEDALLAEGPEVRSQYLEKAERTEASDEYRILSFGLSPQTNPRWLLFAGDRQPHFTADISEVCTHPGEPILDPWNRPVNLSIIAPKKDPENEITMWETSIASPNGVGLIKLTIFND